MARNRRCTITIDSAKVPGPVSGYHLLLTRPNFPNEMTDPLGSNRAQADGGDIQFSSDEAGGTLLPCEIAAFEYDSESVDDAKIEIWVKADLSSSSDTVIYVWYNSDTVESQPPANGPLGSQAVWSSDALVLHLGQDPTGVAPQMTDSTGAHHGTCLSVSALGNSQVGRGITVDTSAVDIGSHSLYQMTDHSIRMWIRRHSTGLETFGCIQGCASPVRGILLRFNSGNAIQYLRATGGTGFTTVNSSVISDSSWHRLYFVKSGANVSIYVDGTLRTDTPIAGSSIAWNPGISRTGVGAYWSTGWILGVDGDIDEFGLSNATVDADWVATDYSNQSDPSTFAVAGVPSSAIGLDGISGSVILLGTASSIDASGSASVFGEATLGGIQSSISAGGTVRYLAVSGDLVSGGVVSSIVATGSVGISGPINMGGAESTADASGHVESLSITIANKLWVRPGNKIIIPGCEPQSTVTSTTLAFNGFCGPDGVPAKLPPPADTPYGKITELYANPYVDPSKRCVCTSALIDLEVALSIIPGSRIVFMDNFGTLGTTQKLFVLPPVGVSCPCQSYEDYYKILRENGEELTPEQEEMVFNTPNCYDGSW